MRSFWIALFFVSLLTVVSAAQSEIVLFNGEPAYTTGITVGGWGSGSAIEVGDRVYNGSRSIKITSQGLHEGGCVIFKNPVDILSEPFDDNTYLQFIMQFATVTRSDVVEAYGPGFGAMPMPGFPFPGSYNMDSDIPSKPKVGNVRIVLVSADGREIDVTQAVPPHSEGGWYTFGIPFKVLGIKQGESFPVSRIMLFTDVPDSVFLGQISTGEDDTPITAYAGEDQVVAIYDSVVFQAEAEAGGSVLRYDWNFGDAGAAGVDGTGEVVMHQYRKGGDYTVTLTVSDIWGMKAPVTSTCVVTVND
ncbi:MAG: PKD domain-containing protein [Armatimonadetes bacterium]|nr:PKD domain-containing protein [Armatimonadota bacterium]